MKPRLFKFVLLAFITVTACQSEIEKNQEVKFFQIDVAISFKEDKIIKLSDIAESVEYIRLSRKDSLIGQAPNVYIDSNYIVVIAFKQQYIFDRKNGDFIRKVGDFERGPLGYRNTKMNLPYNESKKTIYANGWDGGIIEYSIGGDLINTYKKPEDVHQIASFTWLNDSIQVAYVPNSSGNEISRILFYQKNSDEIPAVITNDKFKTNPNLYRSWGEEEGWFYRFKKELYLKELFNDTVFKLINMQLIPKYEFILGKFQPSSYERNFISNDEMKNFFLIRKPFESKDFIFFTLNYKYKFHFGYYDKKKKKTSISKLINTDVNFYDIPLSGFVNDIDEFIQFFPQYMNSENELVALVEAYEVVNWFKNNPDKANKLPAQLKKLISMKENDNPLIMIAKLKE